MHIKNTIIMGMQYNKNPLIFLSHEIYFFSRSSSLATEEVQGILAAHCNSVVTGPARRIVVARARVWASALTFFTSRRRIRSDGPLRVTFVGDEEVEEEAVDQGGPRREFFRLLLPDMIKNCGMLQGTNLFFKLQV